MLNRYVHVDAMFGCVKPQNILKRLLTRLTTQDEDLYSKSLSSIDIYNINESDYCNCLKALSYNKNKTTDELIQLYRELQPKLKDDTEEKRYGVFSLLIDYVREVLDFHTGIPLYHQNLILDWRERTLLLGQDLFTCAGLAFYDVIYRRQSYRFDWPFAIHTDYVPLMRMLSAGISENHFHLNGSTQIFPITWAFLMNHPTKSKKFFDQLPFHQNLYADLSYGQAGNHQDWTLLINIAAWIRLQLYMNNHSFISPQMENEDDLSAKFKSFYQSFEKAKILREEISKASFYGARLNYSKGTARLDYAITPTILRNNSESYRLLVGERSFLYHCFVNCFNGKYDDYKMNLLYLYLIIKIRFRKEIVQNNGEKGFRNFANYQDRKTNIWSNSLAYWEESYRLSIANILSEKYEGKQIVRSLEARIMPFQKTRQYKFNIRSIDKVLKAIKYKQTFLYKGSLSKDLCIQKFNLKRTPYFFVFHFAKKQLKPLSKNDKLAPLQMSARNNDVRKKIEKQARAMAFALRENSYPCNRIRGIDACSHEIGCRPETFATVFRYLRNSYYITSTKGKTSPKLCATYHVGEDFLDLTDGLRAIDEAICFLNLRSGDRIGHALALGTSPEQYYKTRELLTLSKQDLLDNLVWILFRSREWDVTMPLQLQNQLQVKAEELLNEIYGNAFSNIDSDNGKESSRLELNLYSYFNSWKCRGDDPQIYKDILYEKICANIKKCKIQNKAVLNPYEYAKLDSCLWDTENQLYIDNKNRDDRRVQLFLHYYHYGYKERMIGQEMTRFKISSDYIQLIRNMQDVMISKIMKKGFAIECNPSSNRLIGIFESYEEHPIFRFNHLNLNLPEYRDNPINLNVSINTDDIGVFDTSLENEYAIIFESLRLKTDNQGSRLISDDAILEYLNHLRKLGNTMTFPGRN